MSNAFVFVALACEAKPLIAALGLKKLQQISVFDIYTADDVYLTITGVGKAAMAAAVAYTLALFITDSPSVLLNVGIAGHHDAALGQLCTAVKITDGDTAKSHYPQSLLHALGRRSELRTMSQPQLDYSKDCLFDMEASAFYETASRFSSSELIVVLKVISDNAANSVHAINAKQVTSLIASQQADILACLSGMIRQAKTLPILDLPEFNDLSQRLHFTVSQKVQLKKLLLRWQVLTDKADLPNSIAACTSADRLLLELDRLIQQQPIRL